MSSKILKFDIRLILFSLFSCFFISELFFQQYNEYTWHFLMGLVIGLIALLYNRDFLILPSKKLLYLFLFALIATALQAVLNGSHLLEARWINRYMIILLVFVFMQFQHDEDNWDILSWPFLIFLLSMSGFSLFQYLFFYKVDSAYALSTFGARFWNISYYSQAMMLSLPFISYFKSRTKDHLFLVLSDLTAFIIFLTLFAAQSRTSFIGLFLFLVLELYRPLGFNRRKLLVLLTSAFLANTLIWHFKTEDGPVKNVDKNMSTEFRRNLYENALEMAQDFPAGVGTDRFKFNLYLYYNSQKKMTGNYTFLFENPHSEFLQVLTEDGWGIFIIYLLTILTAFFISVRKIYKTQSPSLFYRFYLSLIPEMAFHFPFDLYFPVFLFSIAFVQILASETCKISWSAFKNSILLLIAILILSIYVVRQNDVLPVSIAKPYCSLFQDNFEICKRYFRSNYLAKDFETANEIIRPVIKYQPFNFLALALDFYLASEPRSQIAACLYYQLFNGEHKIAESNVEKCVIINDKTRKLELFNEYGDRR